MREAAEVAIDELAFLPRPLPLQLSRFGLRIGVHVSSAHSVPPDCCHASYPPRWTDQVSCETDTFHLFSGPLCMYLYDVAGLHIIRPGLNTQTSLSWAPTTTVYPL